MMPDKMTKKERTHARILDAASKSFKVHGYNGIGVDGIAKEAGVTSGAFYSHFGSKDSAYSQILAANFEKTLITIPTFQNEHKENWLKAFSEYYLGKEHREDIAGGCWMTALTPEISKASPKIKDQYDHQITQVITLIANGLTDATTKERHDKAWVFLSTLIGGLNMVRAMSNETTINKISKAVQVAALKAVAQS